MIEIVAKEECSGCEACFNACQHNSISMEIDHEGFWYPKVNSNLCVDCGRCNEVCPIENNQKTCNKIQEAYACYCLDADIQKKSSSGGIFSLIAKRTLTESGIVYGAGFNSNIELKTYGIVNEADISQLCCAKYVQSQIDYTYREIKKELKNGKKVAFVGTPCQIAGLSRYLGNNYSSNLLLIDFICHGVPSPVLWKKYIQFRERVDNGSMISVTFRSKLRNWRQYYTVYKYKDRTVKIHRNDDPYLQSFLKNYSLRPSCYNCNFKGINRISDITIGDFWMVNHFVKGMDNNKGTSLVLIHSEKGKAAFCDIYKETKSVVVPFDKVTESNLPLIASVTCPDDRETFFETINKDGWWKIEQIWFPKRKIHSKIKDTVTYMKELLSI